MAEAAAAAELQGLRARVTATSGPPLASKPFAQEWLRFSEAPLPAFARGADDKISFSAPADASK